MPSNTKDFSILLTKVNTTNTKKDIGVVSGYNKLVQQIEQSCKVSPGELMADPFFGTSYFQYTFNRAGTKSLTQAAIANSIRYSMPNIQNLVVQLSETTNTSMIFDISFSTTDFVNSQQTVNCTIEVPLP
jgi:hypothetical protein